MEKLSEEQKKEYNISKELVENVYEDNLLATKVYEYLTLNVDTSTEETEVRHMVLRYIMLPKTYENKSGETVFYSDEEIAARKSRIEAVKAAIKNTKFIKVTGAKIHCLQRILNVIRQSIKMISCVRS